ncbi:MAG: ABC transporter ATP-binding protein [Candidatus Micrarchaeaceae archaeon]
MVNVKVQGLNKYFGSSHILKDISFTVEDGEIFAIIGPSGSGKSTLLRVIAGVEKADTGKIIFGERDYTSVPPSKRNIGMVFQDYGIWPHMSARENVKFVLHGRKLNGQILGNRDEDNTIDQVLNMVGLGMKMDNMPSQLSGGELQRVALARALVFHPDVLLMDEPLSNLDAKIKEELIAEIVRIVKEGKITAIFVTHDQSEAFQIADRIAVIENGEIDQIGIPEDIYYSPSKAFVASFVGYNLILDGRVLKNDGSGTISLELNGDNVELTKKGIDRDLNGNVRVIVRNRDLKITENKEKNTVEGAVISARFMDGQYVVFTKIGDKTVRLVSPVKIQDRAKVYVEIPNDRFFIFASES